MLTDAIVHIPARVGERRGEGGREVVHESKRKGKIFYIFGDSRKFA